MGQIPWRVGCSLFIILAYTAAFSLIAMLDANKARAVVIELVLAFVFVMLVPPKQISSRRNQNYRFPKQTQRCLHGKNRFRIDHIHRLVFGQARIQPLIDDSFCSADVFAVWNIFFERWEVYCGSCGE